MREEKESLWGPSVNLSSAPFTHSSACSVMRETGEVSEISFIKKEKVHSYTLHNPAAPQKEKTEGRKVDVKVKLGAWQLTEKVCGSVGWGCTLHD